jgi:hypothetical protein
MAWNKDNYWTVKADLGSWDHPQGNDIRTISQGYPRDIVTNDPTGMDRIKERSFVCFFVQIRGLVNIEKAIEHGHRNSEFSH